MFIQMYDNKITQTKITESGYTSPPPQPLQSLCSVSWVLISHHSAKRATQDRRHHYYRPL